MRYLEEIAKEYKVDWVNTDIGLGVPMAPGIYSDEEGSLFLNNRCVTIMCSTFSCSALKLDSESSCVTYYTRLLLIVAKLGYINLSGYAFYNAVL